MDDTPTALIEEFRTALLRKRVGQIALAVVLAQAAWRFINSLVWYCIIPIVGKAFQGHTESILFENATRNPFPRERLFGRDFGVCSYSNSSVLSESLDSQKTSYGRRAT
jgi:large-conductance mechanosensitive channel